MKFLLHIFVCSAVLLLTTTGRTQTIPDNIDAILARSAVAGNSWTILIESRDGSTIYYQRNPTNGLAPASNTKMFTTSAAYGLLGTNHAFETRVYANGTTNGGTLTGDLNLVCEHDITWNTSVLSNPRAALDRIATQIKARGLTNITGNVQCYGACFYNLSDTDAGNHDVSAQLPYNTAAATNFVAALRAQGITLTSAGIGQLGFSPPGTLLYTYESTDLTYNGQPLRLDIACIPMLKVSHNVMADALLRHIGYKISGVDSFAAGAAQVIPWQRNVVGQVTNGMKMFDGSGLSHSDSFSASQEVTVLRYMLANYFSFAQALPIGCVDGTLSSRFCGTAGSGTVHAKTGSLSISIGLTGYIDNPNDGRRYLFSFIGNQTSIDQANTRQAIDDAVVLLGARGVPISPQLLSVANTGSNTISLKWSDEKFVRTGYHLYTSTDGVNFTSPISLAPNVQTYTDAGLATGDKRFYKVTVIGSGGESPFSRVYGAQAANTNSRILVVDGYDRWQFLATTDNPQATNHVFAAVAGRSISGPPFDTAHHSQVTNGPIALGNYSSVIWMLGTESTQDHTFDLNEQNAVTTFLSGGGNLFLNGAEIAWDLDRPSGPSTSDRNFYHSQLKAAYFADDANTYNFVAGAGTFTNNPAGTFDNGTHGIYNVGFPDVLTPTNGSTVVMTYVGGLGGAAAVQGTSSGGGKIVNWGFPFETIIDPAVRDAYMSDVLRFFGMIDPPKLAGVKFNAGGNGVQLNWSASSGLKYRVQYKTNLTDAVWQTVVPDITTTNTTAALSETNSASQRFY